MPDDGIFNNLPFLSKEMYTYTMKTVVLGKAAIKYDIHQVSVMKRSWYQIQRSAKYTGFGAI